MRLFRVGRRGFGDVLRPSLLFAQTGVLVAIEKRVAAIQFAAFHPRVARQIVYLVAEPIEFVGASPSACCHLPFLCLRVEKHIVHRPTTRFKRESFPSLAVNAR